MSWLQAGEPVAGASIDTKDNYSTLTVKNVTPKLAGQIEVKAENKVGTDSATFTIEIKGLTNARFVCYSSSSFFSFVFDRNDLKYNPRSMTMTTTRGEQRHFHFCHH